MYEKFYGKSPLMTKNEKRQTYHVFALESFVESKCHAIRNFACARDISTR